MASVRWGCAEALPGDFPGPSAPPFAVDRTRRLRLRPRAVLQRLGSAPPLDPCRGHPPVRVEDPRTVARRAPELGERAPPVFRAPAEPLWPL